MSLNEDFTNISTTPIQSQLQPSRVESNQRSLELLKNQAALVKILSLVLAAASLSSILLGVGLAFFTPGNGWIWVVVISVTGTLLYLSSWGITGWGWQHRNAKKVKLGAYLCVATVVFEVSLVQIVLGNGGSTPGPFLLAPMLGAIFGFSLLDLGITTTIVAILLVSSFLAKDVFNLYKPVFDVAAFTPVTIFTWLLVLIVLAAGLLVFTRRAANANQLIEAKTQQQAQLLDILTNTQNVGANLSRDLSSATNELSTTSKQQASGAQEQVAAVTQVTSSLEELSETANQIAASSQAATSAANQTVEVAVRVSASSETSQLKAEEGRKAVEQTVQSVIQLRNRIELLGQRLLNLTEQNRRVSSIIDLIDEIADETHLLALNASIEAAGTVGGGAEGTAGLMEAGVRQLRSERFGVIAQEIKNLSDRSREATEEVRQAITEMQGAVAAAVLVAEEGKKSTVEALQRAEIAGFVIDNLNEVIANTAHDFDQVLDATEVVKQRCEEISIATNQQRTANVQIVQTMRNIASVAQQTASSVSQISLAVSGLNRRVQELNDVLAVADHLVTSPDKYEGGGNDQGNSTAPSLPAALSFKTASTF